ncbi:uncharacterized protein PAC_18193 [Phialocephala subalpina]|uniref:Heterokaryon incompatibility domain-containing protein n=1 Tax=Phialocephala subalpina TaxID=576137 RepID=A0A1L7XTD1_9HELO|nr:uncharacterized protein PAC_18193 [Phialocephala subalpina]
MCKICTKIHGSERNIRRAEQELRRVRRQAREQAGKQQWGSDLTPIGRLRRDDRVLEKRIEEEEARLREMKEELLVLKAMLPEMPDKDHILATTSARPLTSQKTISLSSWEWESFLSRKRLISNEIQSHPALNLASQEIRLFELTSATGAFDIRGKFHCVSLSASIPYTALSYTWGDPGKSKFIEVGGKRLAIPENLWWFLHCHEPSAPEQADRYWIDAICIDQTNIRDKVFGLLGIGQTYPDPVVVGYSKSVEEIYNEVLTLEFGLITPELGSREDCLKFCSLLRRVLKLA